MEVDWPRLHDIFVHNVLYVQNVLVKGECRQRSWGALGDLKFEYHAVIRASRLVVDSTILSPRCS